MALCSTVVLTWPGPESNPDVATGNLLLEVCECLCSTIVRMFFPKHYLRHEDYSSFAETCGKIMCFVDRATLYNLFQMKPSRCTLLSVFISTSLHVSGNYIPIIMRTYCMYATLVFFTLYGWLSGLQK